jgi:hypothetical protein
MSKVNAQAPLITGNLMRLVTSVKASDGTMMDCLFDYMASTTDDSPVSSMTAIWTAFNTTVRPTFLGCLATDASLWNVTIADIYPNTTPTALYTIVTPGTVTGSSLPNELQVTCDKTSTLKGQHGRGRIQMGPVPKTFQDTGANSNNITTAAQSIYAGLMSSFQATITRGSINYSPVITTRPTAGTPYIYTRAQLTYTHVVRLTMGTQRRRAPGRGI